MTTHSSILAWRIPWTEEPGGGYSPWDRKELDVTEMIYHTSSILQKWVSVFLILGNKSFLYD